MTEKRRRQARLMVLGAMGVQIGDAEHMLAYDLMKITGLSGGRVYTALAQLHSEELVKRVPVKYRGRDAIAWQLS